MSLSHVLSVNPENNALISDGITYKCTPTNCNYGCDSSIFGGRCVCSSCPSDCKKESTTTDSDALNIFRIFHFLFYITAIKHQVNS